MNTTYCQTVTLGMLLLEADVHEKNGKSQEAAKIRGRVADLLSEQSKVVRSVWRQLRKPIRATLVLLSCVFLCSCNKSTPTEERIQDEAAKIAAERARLAELQQEQREKVAADLASRRDTLEAKRAANLERAAAEQARREGITAELKAFIDELWIERSQLNNVRILRMNGYPAKPGSILVSPAGCSVMLTKEDGDFWWFNYEEDAFGVTLKKAAGGLSVAEVQAKQPLADGFEVGQTLPDTRSEGTSSLGSTFSRGLLVLKATYGAGQTKRDVKDLIKSKIQNGRLDFRAHNGMLGGDPAFGQVKTFCIKYVSNNRVMEKNFREGEQVSLP
jgi:multidrug efflux pump subunit AcrA (membrane-fusion protein)